MNQRAVKAVIWDYDGTLVDTRLKNFNVSKSVQETVTGRKASDFPVFSSLEKYTEADRKAANWLEASQDALELTFEQAMASGKLWATYQMKDKTPTPLFEGIRDTVATLSRFMQGIVSQNGRDQILEILQLNELANYFDCIIGYQEVGLDKQKPAADGYINCLEALTTFGPGLAFYVGDHQTDVRVAENARSFLRENGHDIEVVSIGVGYGGSDDVSHWESKPDHVAKNPFEIVDLIESYIHI